MVSGILSDCMVFEVANTNCVDDRCACKQGYIKFVKEASCGEWDIGFFYGADMSPLYCSILNHISLLTIFTSPSIVRVRVVSSCT